MSPTSAAAGFPLHATAIVVGETGILFIGSSGSGKSSTAFACLRAAKARGWNAALVADDSTFLKLQAGRCIASCPQPIKGLLELRGSGVVELRQVDRAMMHLAVSVEEPSPKTRLPPNEESITFGVVAMPLLRLWRGGAGDPLSWLCARQPGRFFAD